MHESHRWQLPSKLLSCQTSNVYQFHSRSRSKSCLMFCSGGVPAPGSPSPAPEVPSGSPSPENGMKLSQAASVMMMLKSQSLPQ